MRLALGLLLVGLAACLPGRLHPAPPPQATRAPAARRMISEHEAVTVALGYARSQGVGVSRATHAHLDGAGRWHVDLRGDHGRDRASVLVDGWTGEVLRAQLKDDD